MAVHPFVARALIAATFMLLTDIGVATEALTEAKCLELGLVRPEVEALDDAALDLARSQAIEAGRWANPRLLLERESVGSTTESTIGIEQPLDLAGRSRLRREAADRRVEAAVLGHTAEHNERAAKLRELFYEVLYRQERVDVTRLWLRRLSTANVASSDRRRLDREIALARSREGAERAAAIGRYQELLALLGSSTATYPNVAGTLAPSGALPPLETVLGSLGDRPEIQRWTQEAAAADVEGQAARRERWPELSIGLGHKSVAAPNLNDSGSVVSLSLALPFSRRGQAATLRAKAEGQRARARQQLELHSARATATGAWHRAHELALAADELRQQARLNSPELLIRSTETAYRNGQASALELLDAHRSAFESTLQVLDLEHESRQARIALDRLTAGVRP